MRSHGESNPDLIFRRDLFYPLNYETLRKKSTAFQCDKVTKNREENEINPFISYAET